MNNKKLSILQGIILVIISAIFFKLLPLYGIMDYYCEHVSFTFFILVIVSSIFIVYLVIEYKMRMNACIRNKARIISILLMLLIEIWALKTLINIAELITNYGGLEYDRLVAIFYTCTVSIIILILTTLNNANGRLLKVKSESINRKQYVKK